MLLLLNLFDDDCCLPKFTDSSLQDIGLLIMIIISLIAVFYIIHKLLPKSLTQSAQNLPEYMPIHHQADILIQNDKNNVGAYDLSNNRLKKIGILVLLSISILTVIFKDIRF
jgi:hypothetical protein